MSKKKRKITNHNLLFSLDTLLVKLFQELAKEERGF